VLNLFPKRRQASNGLGYGRRGTIKRTIDGEEVHVSILLPSAGEIARWRGAMMFIDCAERAVSIVSMNVAAVGKNCHPSGRYEKVGHTTVSSKCRSAGLA
jgi:hypothetical protein